ncbi:MAG: hypothetical protein IIA33_04800 [Planctomycetes bacterium]|nr:hypothetical protein [Planctomycetota bacterium]
MIKFFRKHNKQLLAVFTVLLMIAFVGGTALTSLMQPNPSGDVLFHAFGEPVTNGELGVVNRQTIILSGLRYPWNTPWGFQGRVQPLDERDYFLLLREAEERGLRPGLEQARLQLATLNIDLNQFSLNNKVATEEIELAVANLISVQQLWSMARGSIVPSELEIQQAVRDQYEKLNAHIVEVKSNPLIEPDAEISEDDVLAHFEKYKEQTSGGSALEFGYLIPDRVQVEYLAINTGKIALAQPITEKQAETYWRAHQKDFRPPEAEDDSGEGSSELVGPELPTDPFYLTFAEAREDVVTFLAQQRRLEEARGMASVIWRALREPWYNQPEDEAGFPEAPEAAKAADHYQQTLHKLQNRIPHREAIDIGTTDLFAASEAGDVGRLGSTRVDTQTPVPGRRFATMTHVVQGLVESARPDDSSIQQALASYQTAPSPLIDEDNNLYLYRIIQVQERHAPTSIDEVRDEIVADLRAQRAFESAKTHAEAIKDRIGEEDLKTAYEAYDGLEEARKEECSSFFEANPFPKMNPEIFAGFRFPVIVSDKAGARDEDNKLLHQIRNEEFVADVFKLLESDGEQGVGVIEVPATEKIFVVQLAGVDHVTKPDYENYKKTIQIEIAVSRQSSLLAQWFSAESIRTRCGFKAVGS